MEKYCDNCSEWVVAENSRCTVCYHAINEEKTNKAHLDEWEDEDLSDDWGGTEDAVEERGGNYD